MSPIGSVGRSVRGRRLPDAIPDSEGFHQWNYDNWSGTLVPDEIGDLDADFTDISTGSDEGAGDTYGILDGVDDYGELGSVSRSAFSIFVESSPEATAFSWVKPADTTDIHLIFGSQITSSTRTFNFGVRDGGKVYSRANDGDTDLWNFESGDIDVDEWSAVVIVADGDTARLYAAEAPDYEVTELDTESISGGSSGDLERKVDIGREQAGDQRYWDGGLDLQFIHGSALSEAQLQSFVDDSKVFYE